MRRENQVEEVTKSFVKGCKHMSRGVRFIHYSLLKLCTRTYVVIIRSLFLTHKLVDLIAPLCKDRFKVLFCLVPKMCLMRSEFNGFIYLRVGLLQVEPRGEAMKCLVDVGNES